MHNNDSAGGSEPQRRWYADYERLPPFGVFVVHV